MSTSIAISYDTFSTKCVAGTFRVTAGLKNGITIPPTAEGQSRVIYSSEMSSIAHTFQSAPLTPNQIEFYDIQGTRFCTLSKNRKDNTFGNVTNVSTMPNVLSNIQFPEPSSDDTYLVLFCYPGLHECASIRAKKSFLEQDMELLKSKYPVSELSLFISSVLFDEINKIQPEFWTQFKQVLVNTSNLASFVAEYICGRYVTEKVSNSQHTITFGSKVLTAQFFNNAVKAIVRTEGLQISTWGTIETNFIVFLENPDEVPIVVTDKGTGATFQSTQMLTLEPSVLNVLVDSNKFYKKFPNDERMFQEFSTENSSDVIKYMFCSPLKVFDTLKGVNEIDRNIITFGKGLQSSFYNKLNNFLQMTNPLISATSAWGVPPLGLLTHQASCMVAPHPDILTRQASCSAAPDEM